MNLLPLDKKSFIFYFLMTLILLDFGNQLREISFKPNFINYSNSIFSISHTYNTGSAFGMFRNSGIFLIIFAIIISLFLFLYIYKKVRYEDKLILFSFTLLSAGTIGNLIERIKFHHVIDYIKLNFIDFPIFNAFDTMICTAVVIYAIFIIIESNAQNEIKS